MNFQKYLVTSPFHAMCCSIISAFGILFLASLFIIKSKEISLEFLQLVMSALYTAGAEELVSGPQGTVPKDSKFAARSCFIAAIIYMVFFGFCFCQVHD